MKGEKLHNRIRIFSHLIFWGAWVFSFSLLQSIGSDSGGFSSWLMYYLITLPIFIAHTYLIAYWLIPSYFYKNKFAIFGIWICILLIVFSVTELVVSNEIVTRYFFTGSQPGSGYLRINNILISGLGNHYIILVFFAIKTVKVWVRAKNQKDELAQQNLETENEIFKYRLQPRLILFLIGQLENTNNTQPSQTSAMIEKIADYIHHLFSGANSELIPLNKEARLISRFLEIEEMAIGSRLKTSFDLAGNPAIKLIPPLLVFPFLSSYFKTVENYPYDFECSVLIKVEKKYLLFSLTLWSEENFRVNDDGNTLSAKKRLEYNFSGKYRIIENIETNFKEISIEIFK